MRNRLPVLALAVVVVLGACSDGDDGQSLPPPESVSSTTTTTVSPDYSEVALAPVPTGKAPPSTRPPGRGKASISGRVLATDGSPVAEALVRATFYGDPDQPEAIEVLSAGDGTYRFDHLHGGRWRVRAWKPPEWATFEQPAAFFLGSTEDKGLNHRVKFVPEVAVTSDMAPDPPFVGEPAELAVMVVNQRVDSEGRVHRDPVDGEDVTLETDDDEWSVESPRTQPTESDGSVRWKMSCGGEGAYKVLVKVVGLEFTLTLPACLSPAATSTTTSTSTTTTTTEDSDSTESA